MSPDYVYVVEYRQGESGFLEGVYSSSKAAHDSINLRPTNTRPFYLVTKYEVRHLVPEYGHTVR